MTVSTLNVSDLKWPLTVLFDGTSQVSAEEIKALKEEDKEGHLIPIDATAANFKASDYGLTTALGNHVYARDASGKTYTGNVALEAAHEAVGLGSYFRFTRLPGLESNPDSLRGTH